MGWDSNLPRFNLSPSKNVPAPISNHRTKVFISRPTYLFTGGTRLCNEVIGHADANPQITDEDFPKLSEYGAGGKFPIPLMTKILVKDVLSRCKYSI